MDTDLTVREIQRKIVSAYDIRKDIFVPNVSWGYFRTHEADLVMIHNGYLVEFEIKRSWEDFLADFKKDATHFEGKVFMLYYVVPESIADKCWEFIQNHEWEEPYNRGPKPCGLMTYDEGKDAPVKTRHFGQELSNYTDKSNKEYKLYLEEQNAIMRLGCMRLWNKQNTI